MYILLLCFISASCSNQLFWLSGCSRTFSHNGTPADIPHHHIPTTRTHLVADSKIYLGAKVVVRSFKMPQQDHGVCVHVWAMCGGFFAARSPWAPAALWLSLRSSIAMCCAHVPISSVNQSLCGAASLRVVTVYPLITKADLLHLSTCKERSFTVLVKAQDARTKWPQGELWDRPRCSSPHLRGPQRQHRQGRLLRVTAAETGDVTFHYRFS